MFRDALLSTVNVSFCTCSFFKQLSPSLTFASSMPTLTRISLIGTDLFIAGGGERALFEARACGAQVEIADDNSKLQVSVA